MAEVGLTKPAAGVIATRPATAPAAAPSTLGWPLCAHATVTQVSAPIAAAVFVVTKATEARPFAASALPALNPNQPNQSKPAPRTVIVRSCGSIFSRPRPTRCPRTVAATRAETPDEMCTTVPPAKSSAPSDLIQPSCSFGAPTFVPAQTQWQSGS